MYNQNTTVIDNGFDLEMLTKTIKSIQDNPKFGKSQFRVRNVWVNGTRNASTISDFYCADQERTHPQPFELRSDEPSLLGGTDLSPNPVEYLLHALAACVTTTIVALAAVHGIEIKKIESELEGDIDLRGFMGLDEKTPKGFKNIRIAFRIDADPKNLDLLRSFATFSPVYNTITNGANVDIRIEKK